MNENNEAVEQAVEQTDTQVETAPLQNEAEPNEQVTPEVEAPQEKLAYYQKQTPEEPTFEAEDGFIDPKKFYSQVKADAIQEMREEMRFQETERTNWSKIEEIHPELKTDVELRDLLNAQRIADVATGGDGDLNKIADKFFGKLNSYRNEGKAQAQVSEKVQKSAGLSTQTSNGVPKDNATDLMERMSRGDQVAKETLIEQWLADGKL